MNKAMFRVFAVAILGGLTLNLSACNFVNNSGITSPRVGTSPNTPAPDNGQNPSPVAPTCTIPKLQPFTHDVNNFVAEASVYKRLDPAVYPEAKCNDGSPASYTVRRGVGAGRDRWIIFLMGGELCTNATDCYSRSQNLPQLTTSDIIAANPNLQTIGNAGILAAVPSANPEFFDASVIKVHYCSSDLWTGNKDGQGNFDPSVIASWNFKGHAIVQAVIQDAKANFGLNQATEVLFGGSSAGGFGSLFNLSLAKSLMPLQTRFTAFVEAGFPTNMPALDISTGLPADPLIYPMEIFITEGIALWNAQPDSYCASKVAANPAAGINCFEPASVLSSGATPIPVLIRQTLTDVNFMAKLGVAYESGTKTPVAAANSYVQSVRDSTRQNLNTTDAKHSVMGVDDYTHVLMGSRFFVDNQYTFSSLTQPTTIERQLYEYHLDPCTPKRLIQ